MLIGRGVEDVLTVGKEYEWLEKKEAAMRDSSFCKCAFNFEESMLQIEAHLFENV